MPPLGARAGLWSFVTFPDGDKGKWKCSFCGKRLAGSAGRLAAHLAKDGSDPGVAACTAVVSDEALASAQQFISEANKKRMLSKEVKAARKRSKMTNKSPLQLSGSDGLDPLYRDDADTALMSAICSNMLPLSILEDFHFRKFVMLVSQDSTYTLPHRNMVSSILLDSTLNRAQKEAFDLIESEQENFGSTVMSNILNDSNEQPLSSYILATPSHEGSIKMVECGNVPRDANLLISHLESIMSPKIDMIVLENASASILQDVEAKWNWVNALRCAVQSVSTIFTDLGMDSNCWATSVIRKSLHISSLFRSNHILMDLLRSHGGQLTLLPSDSRIGGHVAMLWRLSETQSALVSALTSSEFQIFYSQQTSNAQTAILNPLRDFVLDASFWTDLVFFIEVSTPVAQLMLQLDGHSVYMGDVIPSFIDAKSRIRSIADYSNGHRKEFINSMLNSLDEAWERIRHPIYSAAYLLHPKYAGEDLGQIGSYPEYEKDLLNVIAQQLGGNQAEIQRAMAEYVSFRAGQGVLQEPVFRSLAKGSMQEGPMPGHMWWQAVGTNWRVLRPFAMKLLGKVPSASHCNKSNQTALPKTCKLGVGTMGKMILIKQCLSCVTNRFQPVHSSQTFADGNSIQVNEIVNYVQMLKKEPVFDDEDAVLLSAEGKLLTDEEIMNSMSVTAKPIS